MLGTIEESQEIESRISFYQKTKNVIIDIYLEVIKHRYVPRWFAVVLIVVLGVQLTGAMTLKNFDIEETKDIFTNVLIYFNRLRIYPLLHEQGDPNFYWIIQYFAFFLVISYIFFLVCVYLLLRMNKFFVDFPMKMLSMMSLLFFWVLFIPIVSIFISIFSCSNGVHQIDTSLKCWTGIHIFYCALFTFGLLLFLILNFLISMFFNESRPNSIDGLKRFDSNLELYLVGYRTITAILSIFLAGSSYNWILLAVFLLGSWNLLRMYIHSLAFYDDVVSVAYGSFVLTYVWCSANFLIAKLINYSEFTGKLLFIGIILSVPLAYVLRDRIINGLLYYSRHNKIDSMIMLDLFVQGILKLANNRDLNGTDEMSLIGFIINHKAECANPMCVLFLNEVYHPFNDTLLVIDKTTIKHSIVIFHAVKGIFMKYTSGSDFKADLHISFSYFLFTQIGNMHMAISELNIAEDMLLTFQQEFTLRRNKKQIEDCLIKRYNEEVSDSVEKKSFKSLDVTIVIKFEEMYNKLSIFMERSANAHMEFWMQLDTVIPDLNIVYKLGLNVTKLSMETEKVWKKLMKLNPNSHKALRNFGNYLKVVRNDEITGEECIDRGKLTGTSENMYHKYNDFDIMFAEDTAIIIMGAGNRESRGKIIKTNSGIFNIFQYKQAEVIGQDINILMPRLIASKHGQFLESYFMTGRERLINHERELYAIRREGSLICISIILKLVPTLGKSIQYIGLIREQYKNNMFILTDMLGRIDSMSHHLVKMLETTHKFISENEVYAQFLFPELLTMKVTNDGSFFTPWERLNDKDSSVPYCGDLQLMIPKEFWNNITKYNKNVNMKGVEKIIDNDLEDEQISEVLDTLNDNEVIRKVILPTSIRRIAQLIHGKKYKGHILSNSNILLSAMNYEDCKKNEIFAVEVKEENYGGGKLKLKAFRIMRKEEKNENENTLDSVKPLKKFPSGGHFFRKKATKDRRQSFADSEKPELHSEQLKDRKDEVKEKTPPSTKAQSNTKLMFVNIPKNEGKNKTRTNTLFVNPNEEIKKDFKKEKDEELNDISIAMNVSNCENTPLALDESFVKPKIKRDESRLQKKLENSPRQDDIIKNFMMASQEQQRFKKRSTQNETKEKKETEERKRKYKARDEDNSSVVSKTKSITKRIKALKNAIYEDYCPSSIIQLTRVANIIFLALFIIAFVYYIISIQLYKNIEIISETVHSSRERVLCVTSMGTCTRTLLLMNGENWGGTSIIQLGKEDDYYLNGFQGRRITNSTSMTYQEWSYYCIERSAREVKAAQNDLSLKASKFKKKNRERINPSKISITYKKEAEMANTFTLDCWSAIMGLVIHGLEVKSTPLEKITLDNPAVYYVLQNSFNSILSAIYNANEAIEADLKGTTDYNKIVLMTLMLLAAISTLISTVMILRIAILVNNSKEDILKLFVSIPSTHIREQVTRCRTVFQVLEEDKHKDGFIKEKLNESKEEKESDENSGLIKEEDPKKAEKSKKSEGVRYKSYKTNVFLLILGFTFFAAIFEGYFIGMYFQSLNFFLVSSYVTNEILMISERKLNSGMMYKTYQEYVGSSGRSIIQDINSEEYVISHLNNFISNQAIFLEESSKNINRNSEEYNAVFRPLMYSDACKVMYTGEDLELCNLYEILNKGLHPATVYFWDFVREFTDNHILKKEVLSEKELMHEFLNNEVYWYYQRMEYKYFNEMYERLLNMLKFDLRNRFNKESYIILIFFVCFTIAIAIIYIFIWRLFVETTRISLWVTKCMLGILSADIILEVQPIKEFLINSSKGLMINLDLN